MINVKIESSWKEVLHNEFNKKYFLDIREKYLNAIKNTIVLPPPKLLFNAFNLVSFHNVKVVILGQDPYHNIYNKIPQAHGLSFSVPHGVPTPPSLKNIFKELNRDLNLDIPSSGNLSKWCGEGVLLLNSILSVELHKAASHKDLGWEQFTNKVIELISDRLNNVVFMLWGKYARNKKQLIDKTKHLILEAAHPSPLANSFIGCGHFSKCNYYLEENKIKPVNWKLN